MEIKFCENDDKRVAVGTGKRPIKWCRPCYVTECGPEFEAWQVTALVDEAEDVEGIACAKTGEVITSGGTVWLDPKETHIAALVYQGVIEALPAVAAVKPKSAASSEG